MRWGPRGRYFMSFGPLHTVGMDKARKRQREVLALLNTGRDPR